MTEWLEEVRINSRSLETNCATKYPKPIEQCLLLALNWRGSQAHITHIIRKIYRSKQKLLNGDANCQVREGDKQVQRLQCQERKKGKAWAMHNNILIDTQRFKRRLVYKARKLASLCANQKVENFKVVFFLGINVTPQL